MRRKEEVMSYKGMSMLELQKVMGEKIRKLEEENLTAEEREMAIEDGRIVVSLAKQMINNGRFILDAEKLQAAIGTLNHSKANDLIGD